jgi:hypothetical protein
MDIPRSKTNQNNSQFDNFPTCATFNSFSLDGKYLFYLIGEKSGLAFNSKRGEQIAQELFPLLGIDLRKIL